MAGHRHPASAGHGGSSFGRGCGGAGVHSAFQHQISHFQHTLYLCIMLYLKIAAGEAIGDLHFTWCHPELQLLCLILYATGGEILFETILPTIHAGIYQ